MVEMLGIVDLDALIHYLLRGVLWKPMLGERLNGIQEVMGSIPTVSTKTGLRRK